MFRRTLLILFLAALPPARACHAAEALDSLLAQPTLDLGLLERTVLERNPSLAAAAAAWRAADAAADQAGALDDPMLDVATAPRSWSSDAVDPAYMISLRQRFPIFGQRGLARGAGRATARSVGEELGAARLELLREARAAFGEYFRVARAHDVNVAVADLVSRMRRSSLARYQAGTAGLTDVLQSEVEAAMLDHEGVSLERDRRRLAARLNAMLGRDAAAPIPAAALELPIEPAPPRADSALALAHAQRPELRGMNALRDARTAERRLADRRRLPEFELEARYDRFMEEAEWRPQVGVGLNLPLYVGRIGAGRREARAKLEEVEWRRAALLARIDAEVIAAVAAAEESGHELMIVRDRVIPASERALEAARSAYESNRGDFASLLNAERDLARARLALYETQVRSFDAAAELRRAVGADDAGEAGRAGR